MCCFFFFFFFSSRRRHTRCSRDWSSDVCSSDLQLAQTVRERVEGERRLLEDRGVGLEADDRPGLLRGAGRGERRLRHAALVALRPLLALAPDLDLEPLAERVDDRDADAVEAARHLVRGVLEL